MPIPYSILLPPLKGRLKWPDRSWAWPAPFDPPIPNQPMVTPYVFRKGGYYQPQRSITFPAPFDPPIPNQPSQRPYIFRRGGFYRPPAAAWRRDKVISGYTRDASGAILPNCEVRLFKQGGAPFGQRMFGPDQFGVHDIEWDATNSDATGFYSFKVYDQDLYFCVSYLMGSPDVAGVTIDTLQGG